MTHTAKKLLNIGGGDKNVPLPAHFGGWQHVLLDIDSRGKPDIVCDARELMSLTGGEYDAVYCSHNLEHYFRHDVPKVLAGFSHLLKPDGFVHIRVPDMGELMKTVVEKKLDIEDFLYQSPAGPICVRDMIYGYGAEIERSGNEYYAHKTGFTRKSLSVCLEKAGFGWVFTGTGYLEIVAYAFLLEPDEFARNLLNLPR